MLQKHQDHQEISLSTNLLKENQEQYRDLVTVVLLQIVLLQEEQAKKDQNEGRKGLFLEKKLYNHISQKSAYLLAFLEEFRIV